MADKNEGEESPWEVVSLTASTYAAAPSPKEVELKDDEKDSAYAPGVMEVEKDDEKDSANGKDQAESSRALFMSSHFVFPPSQHENLLLEPDNCGSFDSLGGKNVAPEHGEGGRSSSKDEENWPLKGLDVSAEFPGMQFFDEKGGSRMSIPGKEFEESTTLQDLTNKEQSIYNAATFSSFHGETGLGGSTTYSENLRIPEVNETPERDLDFPAYVSQSPKSTKDDEIPGNAWWRRRAASLYAHAKEANAFWSIFIAAAVMGIVILGQRWHQERWQVLQLKWQASINNEKSGRFLGPLSRLKDVIVGGNRRSSFIRGSSSSDN